MPQDLSHLPPETRQAIEELQAKTLAALSYERITAPGEQALAEWERLKSQGRGCPVIIGDDDDLERVAEQFSIGDPAVSGVLLEGLEAQAPEDILKAAAKLSFPGDLSNWDGAYRPEDLLAPLGDWPSSEETAGDPGLTLASDMAGGFQEKVHILLLPAKEPWEVFAYLRWGGWNACHPAGYHVAAFRKWSEKYGAEVIGISADTLNVRVTRRPETREDALELAREQYQYCPDLVEQGVGSISNLAAAMMESDWWFFWWD